MSPGDDRLQVFTKMAEADPTNELAHFSLGKAHFELRNDAQAESALRRTLELNPRHAQAHRFLGEALLRMGRKEEAVAVLKAGILIAHERGEFQPRNQMQEALEKAGVEPPRPQTIVKPTSFNAPAGAAAPPGTATSAGGFVCKRCGRANPRMEEAPFLNDLGKQIHDTICQPCWREWFAMSIKVINEYRLNLLSPQGNEVYETHLKEFLGLE